MTVKVGDRLPDVTLTEYNETATDACPVGPTPVKLGEALKGKKIVIFGLPGAFTPTCSAKHAPGFIANAESLAAKGVDEIWCVSVNDAFVMGAWGRELQAQGKVRMLGDGSADFARATGLTLDLTARGMGLRSDRYALVVDDGVVKALQREQPGKFEVSGAEAILATL